MNLLEFTGIYWNLLEFAGIYWNLPAEGLATRAWLAKHYLPEFAHHSFGHQTMADEALFGHQTMADEALFGSMAICEWCPRAIYDIGTEILNFHCFCTMEMFLFSKSIIFSGIGSIFRALSFGTIKTRFKAFWDLFLKICMRPWIGRFTYA